MNQKIQKRIEELFSQLDHIRADLAETYSELAEKYGFSFEEGRIRFLDSIRQRHRAEKVSSWRYLIGMGLSSFLSIPFIYGMIIPAVLLDICLWIYQQTAFRLYRIDIVKRSDYIVFDRRFLSYLNLWQKMNCLYCSYVNGLFAYAIEVGARTERYWCPLKSAKPPLFMHSQYHDFATYGDADEWKEKYQ